MPFCLAPTRRMPVENGFHICQKELGTYGFTTMTNSLTSPLRKLLACTVLLSCAAWLPPLEAQQILGAITGTVKDATGAAVPDATVKAVNAATNLSVTEKTQANGSYLIANLPAGTYQLTVTKQGFQTETHTHLVDSDRTTTIDGNLQVGRIHSRGGDDMETASDIRRWRKSTYSGANGGDCVEVGHGPAVIAIRDTTDRGGQVLTGRTLPWQRLAAKVRSDAR